MTCRFIATDQPRALAARHDDDCHDEFCRGCLPCPEPHCRVCGRAHAAGTCAECMAETREALHDIAKMCDALPEEVEHRGVDGEAMMLLGPAADPEARGHLEASVLAGRVSMDALDVSHRKGCENPRCVGCAGELHPEFVILSWQMVWRDALEHDEAPDPELATAVDYVDRQLTYMAGFPFAPFEDFARDLRKCRTHIAAVIHDQSQGERANVGCFECGGDLERRLSRDGFEDHWTCQRCRRRYTIAEYNFALRAHLEAAASEVTA